MSRAAALRLQIETALARRIPSALTPQPRVVRPIVPTGIPTLDERLNGGLPLGAITEIAGPESSGRTALALAFLAQVTAEGKVAAWVDVFDALDPQSAAASGIHLSRLLWVRCGVAKTIQHAAANGFALAQKYFIAPPIKKGLHGGGFGAHPRSEVKGLSTAVGNLLQPSYAPRCSEPQRREPPQHSHCDAVVIRPAVRSAQPPASPLARIDQALRVTDLLLQAGGFSAIVLDMAGIAPEHALRVPAATWFRYRAAAERNQAAILLLTQHPCAKSSAGLVLRMSPGEPLAAEQTIFAGIRCETEILRERFAAAPANVIPMMRKPPQSERRPGWQSRTTWAGGRP